MNRKIAWFGAVSAIALMLSACTGGSGQTEPSPSPSASPNASASPSPSATPSPSAAPTTFENFSTWGYDLANTRHVPFKEITKENVGELGVVWTQDFKTLDPDVKNGNQSFPVVVDGVIYVTTHGNQVFAFEGTTGKVIWHWKPEGELAEAINKAGITANRGVAIGEGKVFMLTVNNGIVALDQKTGELVQYVHISESIEGVTLENGYYETTAPIYYKGNIYIGSSGGDNGVRGFVMAYKASDLTPAWDSPFWTVPPKGQGWLKDSRFAGGGAVWMPVTIDEETDVMYFATGNPAPDFHGESRPGDNPYTDSVVAVESATGKLVWAQQEVSHDLWDYDAAASPMIIKATVNGKPQKLVVQGGKSGEWWAWDAVTGDVVWKGIPFAKIDHPEPTEEGVLVYPGVLGGQNYAPETYDPETNYVLIPGIEYPSVIKKAPSSEAVYDQENNFFGIWAFGTAYSEAPSGVDPYGTVTAIDVGTGKQVYQYETDDMMRGGFTSTAAGLAFYGELDGKINALDIKEGKILWTFQTAGDNIQAAPAFFMADGKQYMAFTSGGNNPQMHVFALGGDKTQGSTGAADNGSVHDTAQQ